MLLDVGLLHGGGGDRASSGSLVRRRRKMTATGGLQRRMAMLKTGQKPNWPDCREPPDLEWRHFAGWSLGNTRRRGEVGAGAAIRLPSY